MKQKPSKSELLKFAKGEPQTAQRVKILLDLTEDKKAVVVKSAVLLNQFTVDIVLTKASNREDIAFWDNFDFTDICNRVRKELTGHNAPEEIKNERISAPFVGDLLELWKI